MKLKLEKEKKLGKELSLDDEMDSDKDKLHQAVPTWLSHHEFSKSIISNFKWR